MRVLNVRLKFNQIRRVDEDNGTGRAEPCLWTVFFKIDGDTARVSSALALTGTATVRGAPGSHVNLSGHDVEPGEAIAIPSAVGEFNTVLRPIPLEQSLGVGDVGGVVGCVAVLTEEGNAVGPALARGHAALNKAVRESLDALVLTLNFAHQEPTGAGIEQMKAKVGAAVTRAVENSVSVREWLKGFGNVDDRAGGGVFFYDHEELERAAGTSGLEICQRWRGEGSWELRGRVTATLA
ncbi:MAG: hypothetical protein C4333_01365 [Meiothermus sp.]